jgi:hypothetical protein
MTSDEIKKAMINFSPIMYRGIKYKKINAYIYRICVSPHTGLYQEKFQVELQDYNDNSVTIADTDRIEVAE